VSAIIGELNEASALQQGDIGRIHDAIGVIDGVTQQNAALVQEAAAASASLHQQAASLNEIVARFTLQAGGDGGARLGGEPSRLRLA